MDAFLERYQLTQVPIVEIDNLTSPVSISEIEFLVKNLPTKMTPGPKEFTGEFYKTIKEN